MPDTIVYGRMKCCLEGTAAGHPRPGPKSLKFFAKLALRHLHRPSEIPYYRVEVAEHVWPVRRRRRTKFFASPRGQSDVSGLDFAHRPRGRRAWRKRFGPEPGISN